LAFNPLGEGPPLPLTANMSLAPSLLDFSEVAGGRRGLKIFEDTHVEYGSEINEYVQTTEGLLDPFEFERKAEVDLMYRIDQVWLVFVSVMTIVGTVGYYMLEITQIRARNNENLRIKIPVIIAMHGLVFYLFGIGFIIEAEGGFLGKEHFFGYLPQKQHYDKLAAYYPMSVTMAIIASQTVVQRVDINVHIFFSIIANTIIFSVVMSWTFENGLFKEMGFKDFSGSAAIHICGGVVGIVSAYFAGPRITQKSYRKKLQYVLDKANFDDEVHEDQLEMFLQSQKLNLRNEMERQGTTTGQSMLRREDHHSSKTYHTFFTVDSKTTNHYAEQMTGARMQESSIDNIKTRHKPSERTIKPTPVKSQFFRNETEKKPKEKTQLEMINSEESIIKSDQEQSLEEKVELEKEVKYSIHRILEHQMSDSENLGGSSYISKSPSK